MLSAMHLEKPVSRHQWMGSEETKERTLNRKVGDLTEGFLHYLFPDDLREVAYLFTFQFSLL